MLRVNGINFLRSRYFVEDLERRGHKVRLAYFIVEDKNKWENLRDDIISFDEVSEFSPDVLILELGSSDRLPNRDWLNRLKQVGCIVVHCGLGYNDYIHHSDEYSNFFKGGGFGIFNDGARKYGEHPSICGSDRVSDISCTDIETLKKYCAIRDPVIFDNVRYLESRMALIISPFKKILITSGTDSFIKAYGSDRHGENNAVYGALNDTNGIEILITGHFVTDGDERAEGQDNRTFLVNVLEYLHDQHPLKYKISHLLLQLQEKHPTVTTEDKALSIIDAEFTEIKQSNPHKLVTLLASLREHFLNPERHLQATKATFGEVAKHYLEESVWSKAIITYLDKMSETPD